MAASHEIILIAGVLCLLATFAGLVSARVGTPLLLALIGIGTLAGEDGPGGIVVFVVVIVFVAVQGWTMAPAARALRLRADETTPEAAPRPFDVQPPPEGDGPPP